MKQRGSRIAIALLFVAVAFQRPASAHIGSPDVFLEGQAGAYRLMVTVRPPHAIPGIADVEVLATSDDIREVRIVPLPLTGPGAQFAPVADHTVRSTDDPRLFTGHLWLMSAGAWQVRVTVAGERGDGMLSVPVPTLPQSTLAMSAALRAILIGLMVLLGAGFIGIVAALAREAGIEPGQPIDRRSLWRGRIAGAVAAIVVTAVAFFGNMWWTVEASSYDRYVYKPLTATSSITADARLRLELHDPGWISSRRLDDFVPDHGHLMHLFIVSPSLDRFWHLHPDEAVTGTFEQRLPEMPAGEYEVFADVVHATGVSETVTGQLNMSETSGSPLEGDDSAWRDFRLKPEATTAKPEAATAKPEATAEGGKIVWVHDNTPLKPKRLTLFTFRVDDESGQPARDLELYMGMPGHAVFVRRDLKVFAHVHPSGSAPMAAMAIAMPAESVHAQHQAAPSPPSTVTFPYGFPEAGDYKIFVQVKRAGRVLTGVFDATVLSDTVK